METLIDAALSAGRKGLRTKPGSLLLGPTGARLWADYLDPAPGFSGRFDFIHKVNIPLLFAISAGGRLHFEPFTSEWFPSHLRWKYEDFRLALEEWKFITWDDCAVACQRWTNRSAEEIALRLHTYEGAVDVERRNDVLAGRYVIEAYSFDVAFAVAASDPALLGGELQLGPGESRELVIACACGVAESDSVERLAARARAAVAGGSPAVALEAHQREYAAWFAKAPRFASSDPVLDKTWLYRWFILRHNLADPRHGRLQHPLFYEGRSHKKGKRPFTTGGWEFSKLINLSVPLHLTDARWYHDPGYCEGSLRNMAANPAENGEFCSVTVDALMASYANYACWAAYLLYLVHRNEGVMRELLPALKQQLKAWKATYGTERDELMIEYRHSRTGKEYQPSYWYFHNYPKNPKDPETYTPLKRVDRSVYHYLNALGVAKLCEALGDSEAPAFYELAGAIRRDVLEKMWDPESRFFYDLHYQTDEKAWVKNIVGFYPAWAGIVDERHDGLIEHLFEKGEFDTGCPFPSTAADCPIFASEGGWQGHFIKGRNGCMWNGPAWPYTTAIALDALARESKRRGHAFDERFGWALREYSYLHFLQRDLSQPYLVEHYSSRTGEPLSDEPEYNHSYYVDLIVTHVAGLSVQEDRFVLDPVDIGLEYFRLDNVKAAGFDIAVTYKRPGAAGAPADLRDGYHLYVNGKAVFLGSGLARAEVHFAELG